ncbi:MAG: cytochrome c [Vulcanimicrobiota bacterium]
MRNHRVTTWLGLLVASQLFLTGCPSTPPSETPTTPAPATTAAPAETPPAEGAKTLPEAQVVAADMEKAKEDFSAAEGTTGAEEVAALTEIPAASAETVAKGKELFQTNCTTCHGDDAAGNGPAGAALDPPPRNLTLPGEYKYGHLDLAVYRTVKYGSDGTGMVGWDGRMSEDEMWAVVHYVRGIQKEG